MGRGQSMTSNYLHDDILQRQDFVKHSKFRGLEGLTWLPPSRPLIDQKLRSTSIYQGPTDLNNSSPDFFRRPKHFNTLIRGKLPSKEGYILKRQLLVLLESKITCSPAWKENNDKKFESLLLIGLQLNITFPSSLNGKL